MRIPEVNVNRKQACQTAWRVNSSIFVLIFALVIAACSEDKTPPDDEELLSRGAQKHSANSCQRDVARAAEFYACAFSAIETFGLTKSEAEALTSCDWEAALPDASDAEVFERARDAVRARCQ